MQINHKNVSRKLVTLRSGAKGYIVGMPTFIFDATGQTVRRYPVRTALADMLVAEEDLVQEENSSVDQILPDK